MTQYFKNHDLQWQDSPVRGGTMMQKSVIWEGDFAVRSAFFRMPPGMIIPSHTHPDWVQVFVVEGEVEVQQVDAEPVSVGAGECYFVEPGDTHIETAVKESLVLVTQAEDRSEFLE